MYKIPANTLFLGKQLVFVPECHSTNTLALQLSQNTSTIEGAVIITNNQTAGRGQRGNSWEAAPGMNLTFSVVLRPGFLAPKDQFYLNIITSLAVRDFLTGKTKDPIVIKWPNDILVQKKKICGILIENQIQGSSLVSAVAGIGLNINQANFQNETATSLKLVTNAETLLESALHDLLYFLETRYLQLRHQKTSGLREEYLAHLYCRNEPREFSTGATIFTGTIKGIDETGRLEVDTAQGMKYFGIKEITFVR